LLEAKTEFDQQLWAKAINAAIDDFRTQRAGKAPLTDSRQREITVPALACSLLALSCIARASVVNHDTCMQAPLHAHNTYMQHAHMNAPVRFLTELRRHDAGLATVSGKFGDTAPVWIPDAGVSMCQCVAPWLHTQEHERNGHTDTHPQMHIFTHMNIHERTGRRTRSRTHMHAHPDLYPASSPGRAPATSTYSSGAITAVAVGALSAAPAALLPCHLHT